MKNITVYGPGCKNCETTEANIKQYAELNKLDISVTKETDLMAIMTAGVLTTPGVAVDGKIVHTGSVPTTDQIANFL